MTTKTLRLALAVAGLLGTGGLAFAANSWEQSHQRQDEATERLDQQQARIDRERRDHEIAESRARALREHEARIHEQKRAMAAHDSGHVTRQEQERLNFH